VIVDKRIQFVAVLFPLDHAPTLSVTLDKQPDAFDSKLAIDLFFTFKIYNILKVTISRIAIIKTKRVICIDV
jgi:hypothetical protein